MSKTKVSRNIKLLNQSDNSMKFLIDGKIISALFDITDYNNSEIDIRTENIRTCRFFENSSADSPTSVDEKGFEPNKLLSSSELSESKDNDTKKEIGMIVMSKDCDEDYAYWLEEYDEYLERILDEYTCYDQLHVNISWTIKTLDKYPKFVIL